MLADVAPGLSCPVCNDALAAEPARGQVRRLTCTRGHCFDVSRHGHVSLLRGGHRHAGDDATMVGHRLDFLRTGQYDAIAAALATRAAQVNAPGLLVDVGGGPGWYAARVLDALPDRLGVSFDTSTAAARRAARAHPRLASVVADGWAAYPVNDGAAALVLCVFAPRNPAEMARVLHPDGVLLVVTPTPDHLREARAALPLVGMAGDKEARLAASLRDLVAVDRRVIRHSLALSHVDLGHLILMGPSAFHVQPDPLATRIAALPEPFTVTCAVTVSSFRRPA